MTNEDASPPFEIRSTSPGQRMELKEWSHKELSMLIATYQERYPEPWQAYLEAESERGFVTNAVNDQIMAHIEQSAPGFHSKHYRVGAVDFRFANERAFHFRMWQPENRQARWDGYWAYVREMQGRHQPPHVNGAAEWTVEQVNMFTAHLQQGVPEFWTKICEVYNELGFSEGSMVSELRKQVAVVFAVPEDIDYSTIGGRVVEEANRVYRFEMMKPENLERRRDLQDDWMRQEHITFDEWREGIRLQK